jgi:hypothetical protein
MAWRAGVRRWVAGGAGGGYLLLSEPALASPTAFLPATFLGEVAVVALAFSMPALVAGLWLGLKRLGQRLGRRGALVGASLGVMAASAAAFLPMGDGSAAELTRLMAQAVGLK